MKKILIVIGTRPNIIKITQFKKIAASFPNLEVQILHTGQHYDHKMAQVFFDQFEISPDYRLELDATTPVGQVGEIMIKIEKALNEARPDIVLVPGDVNSTFAAAFAAHRSGYLVGHIESGLRSFDRGMPEEINRILTDEITDVFFVTEPSGTRNLLAEGKSGASLYYVGNTMIDTLVAFGDEIDKSTVMDRLGVVPGNFYLFTFHRPSNVDNLDGQRKLMALIKAVANKKKCVFPIHPRTRKALDESGLLKELLDSSQVILSEPLGYFDFQQLVKNSAAVITDSGGIQEETTYRQVPCITLRPNTERPVTIDEGSNVLLPFDEEAVLKTLTAIEKGKGKKGTIPKHWDGQATKRILEAISSIL